MVTVPCDGAVWPVTVRPIPGSLANTLLPDSGVFASVAPASSTATGVTRMLTVDVMD